MIEKVVGRGRSGPNRERHVIEQVRSQRTTVERDEKALTTHQAALGWRASATNAPETRFSFEQAVLEYRNDYRGERNFGRFKGDCLGIAPLSVKRDDQVKGLTRLFSLAGRVLTLMECVRRRNVKEQERTLAGLSLDSPNKTTARPTAERFLRAFVHITLIVICFSENVVYQVKGLSHLHQEILAFSGLPPDVYPSFNWIVPKAAKASAAA